MEFSIKRNLFIKRLNDVQKAISSRTTIDILTGIKIETTNNSLVLTGSNSDISIKSTIETRNSEYNLIIIKTGGLVLPSRLFSEIIKKLPGDEFSLSVNDHYQAKIISGTTEYKINGVNSREYPHLPNVDIKESFSIDAQKLKNTIKSTVFAVSNQETRPLLTGIHIRIYNSVLQSVATDSHRLSQKIMNLSEKTSQINYNIIVPGKSLLELEKMITDNLDNIDVKIIENQILFHFNNTLFYSRLLDGNYPDTDRLIPRESSTKMVINALFLLNSIERASLLSHEGRNNVVKLTINVDKNYAKLSSNSPEVGNIEEKLQFIGLEGRNIEISFNPDYMKDSLKVLGNCNIKLSFTLPLRPFTLVPYSDKHDDFIQLITPVRTF